MTARSDGTPPHLEGGAVGSTRPARAGLLVVLAAVVLIGVPFAYRVATESPLAGSSPAPAGTPTPAPSITRSPAPATPGATALSDTDRALEHLQVAGLFANWREAHRCDMERIPLTRDRSVTLGGRVEAHDHAGWVFTCHDDAGDRTRYFRLASGVATELQDLGVEFQGGLSFVGPPGGTLETRWIVAGDALSGEIEMIAGPIESRTFTILVLLDLRGSWDGAEPSS
jgi:hypothetical protein